MRAGVRHRYRGDFLRTAGSDRSEFVTQRGLIFRDGRAVPTPVNTPRGARLREPQAWSRARLAGVLWGKGVYPRHFSSGFTTAAWLWAKRFEFA